MLVVVKIKEMNVSELRLTLIDKIMHMKAEALESIESIINDAESENDWWDLMSVEQQVEIDEGLAEADRGEGIPHKEVMKTFDEWK